MFAFRPHHPATMAGIAVALTGTALLAACSTTPSATPATSAPTAPRPTPVPTAGLACTDFDMAATHITSRVQVLGLNAGTQNDNTANWDELYQAAGTMAALAPECAPDAATDIDSLLDDIAAYRAAYQTGTDQATKDADMAAAKTLATAAIPVWEKLGFSTVGWENAG